MTLTGGPAPGFAVDALISAANGDININMTGANTNLTLQGSSGTSGSRGAIAVSGAGTGNINITATGANTNIIMNGGPGAGLAEAAIATGAAGNIVCDITGDYFLNGGTAGIQGLAFIVAGSSGFIDLSGRNFFITGGGPGAGINEAQITAQNGDVTLTALGNIQLMGGTGVNTNAIIQTLGSTLTIIAGTDIILGPNSVINNGGVGPINLVVDNQFPFVPLFGSGALIMDPTATITTTNGAIRLFTSQQQLNTISGTMGGFFFSPGPIFQDTNQEMWGIYFPALIAGIPFTVF